MVGALLGEGQGHQIVLNAEFLVAEMHLLVGLGVGCGRELVLLEEVLALAPAHLGYGVLQPLVFLEDYIVLLGQELVLVLVAQQHGVFYLIILQLLADLGKVALEGIYSVHQFLPLSEELDLFQLAGFQLMLVLLSQLHMLFFDSLVFESQFLDLLVFHLELLLKFAVLLAHYVGHLLVVLAVGALKVRRVVLFGFLSFLITLGEEVQPRTLRIRKRQNRWICKLSICLLLRRALCFLFIVGPHLTFLYGLDEFCAIMSSEIRLTTVLRITDSIELLARWFLVEVRNILLQVLLGGREGTEGRILFSSS